MDFTVDDGYITFTVPKIVGHQIVELVHTGM